MSEWLPTEGEDPGQVVELSHPRQPVAVVICPSCPHTLASAYVTAFIRERGGTAIPYDLEFDLSVRRRALWRTLRAVFNCYALSELPRVQFVLRPELLLYSLWPDGYAALPPGVSDAERDLDEAMRPEIEHYARVIVSAGCRSALFSVIGSNLWFALLLAQALQRLCPGMESVFGGPSLHAVELRNFLQTLPFVTQTLEADHPGALYARVANLCGAAAESQDWNRATFEQLPRPDLTGWPWPGRPFHDYALRPAGDSRQIPIAASIGCPYRCDFCFDSVSPPVVTRSPQSVTREMAAQIRATGANLFVFCDPTLNPSAAWLEELCERMERELPSVFVTFAHFRLDRMTRDMLERLARVGFVHINFGLESFSVAERDRMRKDMDTIDPEATILSALASGMAVSINLMSEYDRADAERFVAQVEGLTRLHGTIRASVPHPRVQFIVSRLRLEPHSALHLAGVGAQRAFSVDWPRTMDGASRAAFQAMLWQWRESADSGHASYLALDALARNASSGGSVYRSQMSLFRPETVFQPLAAVDLLHDGEGNHFVTRERQMIVRLNDEARAVWTELVAGRTLSALEDGRDGSVRPLLCLLLEERCITIQSTGGTTT